VKKRHATKEKAGVVVYRSNDGGEPLVLVVSARKFKDQWVFPVGTVEKGESLETAARRECEEESGYRVDLELKLPPVLASKSGKIKRFTFFLATLIGEAPQWETDRQRHWLPADQVVDAMPDVFQGVARQAVARISKTLLVRHA
jgi:8-oxo-dGTP pyrophosphatase MutT (NUDIX family)